MIFSSKKLRRYIGRAVIGGVDRMRGLLDVEEFTLSVLKCGGDWKAVHWTK